MFNLLVIGSPGILGGLQQTHLLERLIESEYTRGIMRPISVNQQTLRVWIIRILWFVVVIAIVGGFWLGWRSSSH